MEEKQEERCTGTGRVGGKEKMDAGRGRNGRRRRAIGSSETEVGRERQQRVTPRRGEDMSSGLHTSMWVMMKGGRTDISCQLGGGGGSTVKLDVNLRLRITKEWRIT